MVKIRPWPFNQQQVVSLHWFGNVKQGKDQQWYLQAAFKESKKCQILELPIGAFPLLRLGQFYRDGLPLSTQKAGSYNQVMIEDLGKGKTIKAIDACKKFGYFLYKMPELIHQHVWSFSSNGITYYVSHAELIRALYVKYKLLANALLRPNGLDLLINNVHYLNSQTVFIELAHEIPSTIVTNEFVHYMAWLYLNDEIKKSFCSVQTNTYSYAANQNVSYGIPLEMAVPSIQNTRIAYRGIQQQNEVLILELSGIDNITLSVFQIQYSHKSIKRNVYTNAPKKTRISQKNGDTEYVLNEKNGKRSKEDTHQPVIEQEPTQFAFRHSVVIKRISKQAQKVNKGNAYISNKGRGGATQQQIVGVDESIFGGTVAPIEFQTLEIADSIANYGLDQFFSMIQYLSQLYPHLSVSVNVVYLPLGRKFSRLPDGRRRVCAVARIVNQGKVSYIIEVAVPDNRSISTLIIPSVGSLYKDELHIQKLLRNLVYSSGSWSNTFLQTVQHTKVKHLQETARKWAERLLRYI